MHRSTTTAALLVSVAVTALSGCMTVERQAAPGPPPDTARAQQTAGRPDGSAEPRVVQAPAREALERVGPPRHPAHSAPRAPHPAAAPPVARRAPAPPAPRPERRRADGHRHTGVDVPDLSHPAPQAPDVCALGRRYGGWRGDSPESVICERAYGH
ncbi:MULTISPECIES: hypothetical protein [unclassified Streptomyces]|uniref:hypothetical protein n=1 Tax=unclassified Streptomyces TaxID=2593676 RepID=UPI000ADE28F8|nr:MULTISPECIES: hypothetical protein [unclassified Streptomyces]PKW06402.1 hypothetical protein BX260_1547 [Streptomyces sp. 5112.2]